MEDIQKAGLVILIVLLVPALIEVGILMYAYLNADKVECNFVWCTFTTERTVKETRVTEHCMIDNVEVNCSELDKQRGDWDWAYDLQ